MQIQSRCFNIYLAVILIAGLCGCASPQSKQQKIQSFLRVHIEAASPIPNRTRQITLFRMAPMQMYVEPLPFVTEEYVKNAQVVDSIGGFSLQIELNRSGQHLLEQYTAGNNTRRIAIFSHFEDPKDEKNKTGIDRWLAAPKISQAIVNGILVFTPDASREEAEMIALGLRNVARKLGTDKEPDL